MLNKMCNDCTRLHRDCEGTTCQVWDGCLLKKTTMPICNPKLIIRENEKENPFRVELWYSYDGGNEFECNNLYKDFSDYGEARKWRKSMRENLEYDLAFGCLGNGITAWNMMKAEHGEYQYIAHIDDCGMVYWYVDEYSLPKYARKEVYDFALRNMGEFKHEFFERDRTTALCKIYRDFMTALAHIELKEKTVDDLYEIYLRLMCTKGYCKPIEM